MNLKGLWAEFKAFAFKGNMIELAVAVVIGAAFSTVITSLVNDVIMPTVTYVVHTATTAAASATNAAESAAKDVESKAGIAASQPTTESTTQSAAAATPPAPAAAPATPAAAPGAAAPPVQIHLMLGPVNAGNFIGALINFLLVAAAVFLVIVKLLGSVMNKMAKSPEPSAPVSKECPKCCSIIPIKATKCPNCTADLPAVAT
jgi:large conductance mechanosensitive channel